MEEIVIDNTRLSLDSKTYFIADIAANHDGDINRAKDLIYLAADAGADAAKFQNFTAEKIVSRFGFESLDNQKSHQKKWRKSVFDVYKDASIPFEWTPILKETCDKAGIHYFSSPYDFEAVDMLLDFVPAYKIGSGDITWYEILKYIAKKGKPVLLATGAANILEVKKAVDTIREHNGQILLMQCNTNYTASIDNFKFINLKVLELYKTIFPQMLLGLSDHTPGHTTVLGAVALGAKAIEKHFTDDTSREGPDHAFSMNPISWREMVNRTRELEYSMGTPFKKIEDNEQETVIVQRRCIRAARNIMAGEHLNNKDLECLRPCPGDALEPHMVQNIINKKIRRDIKKGKHIIFGDIEWD